MDNKWLTKKLYSKINPKMKGREMVFLTNDILELHISEGQAKRTKLAVREIQGLSRVNSICFGIMQKSSEGVIQD